MKIMQLKMKIVDNGFTSKDEEFVRENEKKTKVTDNKSLRNYEITNSISRAIDSIF